MAEIIQNFQEFSELVSNLHGWIEEKRATRLREYDAIGMPPPPRVRFEELDLHDRLDELLSVQKTLQWRGHHSALQKARLAPAAREVAFAGICQFVKDDYDGRFWDAYKRRIGWGQDTYVYETLWAKAFREMGAELLRGYCRREFVQSFVLEAGIPKHRNRDIIEFFVMYWRYFRDWPDVEGLLHSIQNEAVDLYRLPFRERARLQELCELGREFPIPFARVVAKLGRVLEFVEGCGEITGDNILDSLARIREGCGFDPLEIMHDRASLQRLFERVCGLLPPSKLEAILATIPPATTMQTPCGAREQIRDHGSVEYGTYVLDGAQYTCVPSLAYSLEDLSRLPEDQVVQHGSSVLLRSRSTIRLLLNGRPRDDFARRLHITASGRPRCLGYLLYVEMKPAISLEIETENGVVQERIDPEDGVAGTLTLQLRRLSSESSPLGLQLLMPRLLVSKRQLATRTVGLYEGEEAEPRLELALDAMGGGRTFHRVLPVGDPTPGTLSLRLLSTDDLMPVSSRGNDVRYSVELEPAMLFSACSGRPLRPRKNGDASAYGGSRFVLFHTADTPGPEPALRNFSIRRRHIVGGFECLEIQWQDTRKPCRLRVEAGDTTWEWAFERCLDLRLSAAKDPAGDPQYFALTQEQGTALSQFTIQLTPAPSGEDIRDLHWAIVRDDEPAIRLNAAEVHGGTDFGGSVFYSGEALEAMLSQAGISAIDSPTRLEFSLCGAETVFSSLQLYILPGLTATPREFYAEGQEVTVDTKIAGIPAGLVATCDHRARGRARLNPTLTAGNWIVGEQEYSGTLRLAELSSQVEICFIPRIQGYRLINETAKSVERVRTLARRELPEYSLLLIDYGPRCPRVQVRGKASKLSFRNAGPVHVAPLSQLEHTVDRQNDVSIATSTQECRFTVTFDGPEILEISLAPHLRNNTVVGTVTYLGPRGSGFVVSVHEEPGDALAGQAPFYCVGRLQKANLIQICIEGVAPAYSVTVETCRDLTDQKSSHSFGRTWRITRSEERDDRDIDVLRNAAVAAYQGKQFFRAIELADAVLESSGSKDREMLELWRRAECALVSSSVARIADQVSRAVRKEFYVG